MRKFYSVGLRRQDTGPLALEIGIVEANSEGQAAEILGVALNAPDAYSSHPTWNLHPKYPGIGDVDGGGIVTFSEVTEITSAEQFRELLRKEQL